MPLLSLTQSGSFSFFAPTIAMEILSNGNAVSYGDCFYFPFFIHCMDSLLGKIAMESVAQREAPKNFLVKITGDLQNSSNINFSFFEIFLKKSEYI